MKLNENTFYTTEDLFYEIVDTVKAKGKWDDKLIDYALADDRRNLCNYEFSPCFVLCAGGCEGYYLTLSIYGCSSMDSNKCETVSLGTIKTLGEDEETIRAMSELYGECLIAYEKIIDRHMDDLTRIGYDVSFYVNDQWKSGFSGFREKGKAEERVREIFKAKPNYTRAVIRNNLTRAEQEIRA